MPTYVAIRTDRSSIPLILSELEAGRLRQGWGWEDYHDLRSLRAKRQRGEALVGDEHDAWLNRRLYEQTWDGLQDGDVVLLPNLPEPGRWLLARINGPYSFDRSAGYENHGHLRRVEVVRNPTGALAVVHPTHWLVPAGLRRSMRTPKRTWSLEPYAEAIESILRAIERGEATDEPTDVEERFDRLADELRAHAYSLIDHAFGGAELEHLVVRVLRGHHRTVHPKARVEHLGGRGEHGIDVLIVLPGPYGTETHIGVQVKKHDGTEWSLESLDQLRRAKKHWSIDAGMVLTTATETNESFDAACNELEDELEIPIHVVLRDRLIDLVLAHLGGGDGLEG